mmetsp:Transcript_3391/g.7010  ORF Transcript_3391/g.7010 Transcript_3391/m.7010 type:complete len:98 (-) Transcript_3391:1431-1724(-)
MGGDGINIEWTGEAISWEVKAEAGLYGKGFSLMLRAFSMRKRRPLLSRLFRMCIIMLSHSRLSWKSSRSLITVASNRHYLLSSERLHQDGSNYGSGY